MTQPSDFTVADVLKWARTKPADESYRYTDPGNCALCHFLRDTGRAAQPSVGPWVGLAKGNWSDTSTENRTYPRELEPALGGWDDIGLPKRWTFGLLVKRLESLASETPVTRSDWEAIDAYLTDIETVAA